VSAAQAAAAAPSPPLPPCAGAVARGACPVRRACCSHEMACIARPRGSRRRRLDPCECTQEHRGGTPAKPELESDAPVCSVLCSLAPTYAITPSPTLFAGGAAGARAASALRGELPATQRLPPCGMYASMGCALGSAFLTPDCNHSCSGKRTRMPTLSRCREAVGGLVIRPFQHTFASQTRFAAAAATNKRNPKAKNILNQPHTLAVSVCVGCDYALERPPAARKAARQTGASKGIPGAGYARCRGCLALLGTWPSRVSSRLPGLRNGGLSGARTAIPGLNTNAPSSPAPTPPRPPLTSSVAPGPPRGLYGANCYIRAGRVLRVAAGGLTLTAFDGPRAFSHPVLESDCS
jgi:hypothetical protein